MAEDFSIELKNVNKFFPFKQHHDKTSGMLRNIQIEKNILVALNDISFTVSKGEVVGILGLNGSGKTTLLRVISGIYKPDVGTVTINGNLAPLLQIGTGFHEELKANENIIIYGMLLGFKKHEIIKRIDKIINFAELEEFSELSLKHYSTGMRVRLAFSIALEMDPDILLIDEVLAVGDIKFQKKSFESIISFKNRKKTILFTTHNISMISQLANKALILNQGKIEKIGEPNEIIETYKELTKN